MSSPDREHTTFVEPGPPGAGPRGGLSIECREVLKLFPTDDPATLLRWHLPELSVARGETVMITGPSGCGKTTLVNLLSGLLKEDSGEITVEGVRVDQLSLAQADVFRGDHLGLVFQSFQLLRPLTVRENLLLGARYGRKLHGAEAHARADELVEQVGLGARRHYRAAQLSIGEQQRVAVARALINEPAVVLADEPTASLDPRNAEAVLDLLLGLCEGEGATLVLVTHNAALAPHFGRCLEAQHWMSTVAREEVAAYV
jgi:ABC-type lipoprotein export system ATPase subunit